MNKCTAVNDKIASDSYGALEIFITCPCQGQTMIIKDNNILFCTAVYNSIAPIFKASSIIDNKVSFYFETASQSFCTRTAESEVMIYIISNILRLRTIIVNNVVALKKICICGRENSGDSNITTKRSLICSAYSQIVVIKSGYHLS